MRHSKGTWALEHSRNSRQLETSTLRHFKGDYALGHSKGTSAVEALEALYLANSNEKNQEVAPTGISIEI